MPGSTAVLAGLSSAGDESPRRTRSVAASIERFMEQSGIPKDQPSNDGNHAFSLEFDPPLNLELYSILRGPAMGNTPTLSESSPLRFQPEAVIRRIGDPIVG